MPGGGRSGCKGGAGGGRCVVGVAIGGASSGGADKCSDSLGSETKRNKILMILILYF